MKLPEQSGSFEKCPAGNHLALCYEVIDLGTQDVMTPDGQKRQHKIWIGWETCFEKMEDGRPFVIGRKYTLSSHEKSTLRKDLESWRGKAFSDEDFGSFEIGNVLGVGCFLNVVHVEKGDRTYANIQAVAALPKGTDTPDLVNAKVLLDLTEEGYDPVVFDNLSDRMKEWVSGSPEWQAVTGGSPVAVKPIDESDDNESPF